MKRVLITATVQSHICQFHKPLMRLLKENDYEVDIAARYNLDVKDGLKLEYPDQVYDIPFDRSPLNIVALIKAWKALNHVLAKHHYDIIHCNTPVAGVVTRLAARKLRKQGTKVFYTAHGFHFYNGAPKKNWIIYYPIEKWMSRYTDVLITITDEDYQFASKHFPCKVERMHGVGADSNRFHIVSAEKKRSIRRKLGFDDGLIILNIGELLPNKNQKTAIMAMQKVLKDYPKAKLLIAGNGPEKENLEQLIDSYHMTEHVQMLGYTTSIDQYVKACDVLVSCSFREGMPLNIMEAMLCGKPVVASHNRGHDELVKQGQTGYLVEANDINGFANKIRDAYKNLANRQETIRDSVTQYTDNEVINELKSLYGL